MNFRVLLLGAACTAGTAMAAEPPKASTDKTEPAVQRAVAEDDNVRIEELRVRGLTQRVVVQPKIPGVKAYEIEPPEPGRDTTAARGGSGQRVWRVLSF